MKKLRIISGLAQGGGLALALLGALAGPAAGQAKPELLGTYADWDAYILQGSKGPVCYVSSQPVSTVMSRKAARRGPAYLLITFRPKANVANEVSVLTGYPYRKDSIVEATIDKTKFEMYTVADSAWVQKRSDERRMVQAMRKGSTLIIKGVSGRGTRTTDTYSLDGISAALDELQKNCK